MRRRGQDRLDRLALRRAEVALERAAAVGPGIRGRGIGPGVLLAAGRGQQGCDRDTGDEFSHCRLPFPHSEQRASGLVCVALIRRGPARSEEHTSELQSLMRISYAVFCLKKKNNKYRPKNDYKYKQIVNN